jgi:hypothetical protein
MAPLPKRRKTLTRAKRRNKPTSTIQDSRLLVSSKPDTASSSPLKPKVLYQERAEFSEEDDSKKPMQRQVQWISDGGIVLIFTPDEFLKFQEFLQEKPTLGTSASNILNSSASNLVDSTIITTTPHNVATERGIPNILSEPSEIGNTSNILEPLCFNNHRVDFRKVNCFQLNFQAFETKSTSHNQSVLRSSENAVRIQAHRATLKIVSAILDCGKSDGQRALALHRALIHPKIREIAKSAGFQNENMKELSYHSEQIKEFISLASHTRNKQGRPKKEESEVIQTIVAALSADVTVRIDGNIMKEQKAPSGRSTSRLYGFSPYHAKKGMLNRQKIVIAKASGPNSRWWNILRRQHKGRRNIPSAIRDAVIDWVVNHENVIPSPLLNETILVTAPGSTQKRRVTKLLLEIPVRELHNKMLSELAETRDTGTGKALVSDTSLRRIIKEYIPNLRRISTRHKEMCCCTICQTVFTLQRSLNAFRRRQLNSFLREINNQTEDSVERDEAKRLYEI